MKVSIIAAESENHVIGVDGELPWKVPADMRYFMKKTTGHHIIMGRKTYEEGGVNKPLPKRVNIIVTRQKDWQAEGCIIVHSIEDALKIAEEGGEQEAFVIGGEQIYRLALEKDLVDKIYLTQIEVRIPDGDAFFPTLDRDVWERTVYERYPSDEKNMYAYAFREYQKKEDLK
ncbi:MAG: dihydrofolate reductase [Chitinophagales bacterium]